MGLASWRNLDVLSKFRRVALKSGMYAGSILTPCFFSKWDDNTAAEASPISATARRKSSIGFIGILQAVGWNLGFIGTWLGWSSMEGQGAGWGRFRSRFIDADFPVFPLGTWRCMLSCGILRWICAQMFQFGGESAGIMCVGGFREQIRAAILPSISSATQSFQQRNTATFDFLRDNGWNVKASATSVRQ